ncbi:hypothetical protein QJQ45_028827, partial [Haematococcus lacustris]
VANRWNAFLPNLAAVRPNVGQKFAQVVHTDGVAVSVMFTRPKPAEPPGELPRMGKEEGAVNPLAHLDADWLGCDPGKTNMATVAHEERYPSGAVKSVWERSLTAGQYYRQSGITEHAKESKVWMAGIKPQQDELSQVTNYTASLQRFRLYGGKQRTVAKFWAETVKGARVRCNSAVTGRPLALAYGAAGFSGSGSIGSKGVPVKQMRREACKQFPGRVVLVHEFRTSRVSSARTNVVAAQAESLSMATRSQIRGLMCSTSIVIKRGFYDRDVSAALNIRRIAAGPGRPRELSSWLGRPAMPNPGRPSKEWVQVRDGGLLRKWQRRHQRQRQQHICDGFTLLFSMAKQNRRTVPRLVPEDPDSDIEDRDEALQPDLTEAERNRKISGEARAARDRDHTHHGRKCKIAHLIDHLPQELWDAFLDDAVQPRVEAISERAVLASLLFGLLVRGLFAIHVADPLGLHDQPVYTDIPVSQAAIPDLSCRNLLRWGTAVPITLVRIRSAIQMRCGALKADALRATAKTTPYLRWGTAVPTIAEHHAG